METRQATGTNQEKETWQALKRGDEKAVAILLNRYYRELYHYGVRISKDEALTEDCIQDLFVELWVKREKLSSVEFVKPYLIKSLRRRIAKKNNANLSTDIELIAEWEFPVEFSYEEFIIREHNSRELTKQLQQALNSLSPRQREVIYLKFYENLTYEQIADVMSITITSLYDLLSKSVKKLKNFFSSVIVSFWLFCFLLMGYN